MTEDLPLTDAVQRSEAGAGPTAHFSSGTVRGREAGGIMHFSGVPYAAAPFGRLRFAAPEPHQGWVGERDATAPGATRGERGETRGRGPAPWRQVSRRTAWPR